MAFLISAVVPLDGQIRLSGTVVDSAGLPVALVEVTTAATRVLTSSLGRFSLTNPRNLDSLRISFRRVGFQPLTLVLSTDGIGPSIDLEPVVMAAVPIRLDDIQVEALRPILSSRGIREFEFARREGFSRYFITAYDIERLRPFGVSGLTQQIPGARNAQNAVFGNAIQLLSRSGTWCTATIVVDGISTRNTDPDAFVSPERIGAMWYSPSDCRVHIWTKPIPVEQSSSFEIGFRVSGSDYGRGIRPGGLGGYMALPLVPDRFAFYPAFAIATSQPSIRWLAQLAFRVRVVGKRPALYVGTGVRFRKFEAVRSTRSESVFVVLGGIGTSVGPLRVFSEVSVVGLWQTDERRAELVFGVGYHN